MKKRKIIIPIIMILALSLVMTGCGNGDIDDYETATKNTVQINGQVAVNRQGEGDQSGIKVTVDGKEKTATTDENGDFSLTLTKGETYDLVATREDLATTRIQGLVIDEDNPIDDIKIMIKKPSNEKYADEDDKIAPEITVEGLKNFGVLNRNETVKVSSNKGIRQYYVDLIDNYGVEYEDLKKEITIANKEFPLNHGGGIQQVVVAVVDQYNNITQKIYQMKMPEEDEFVPVPPAVPAISVFSETYNTSINLLDHPEVGLESMPEDTMLINFIEWPSTEVSSYNVYRSFDGENYNLIDTVKDNSFVDVNPSLEVGKRTWYKVSAVNESGEGDYSPVVYVTPLPVYELSLKGPDGSGLSITPDLEWSSNDLGVEDLEYEYQFMVRDTNGTYQDPMPWTVEYSTEDKVEINSVNVKEDLGFSLDRGTRYEWTILNATARKTYIDKDNVYSEAVTYGAYEGFGLYPENSSMFFETLK